MQTYQLPVPHRKKVLGLDWRQHPRFVVVLPRLLGGQAGMDGVRTKHPRKEVCVIHLRVNSMLNAFVVSTQGIRSWGLPNKSWSDSINESSLGGDGLVDDVEDLRLDETPCLFVGFFGLLWNRFLKLRINDTCCCVRQQITICREFTGRLPHQSSNYGSSWRLPCW